MDRTWLMLTKAAVSRELRTRGLVDAQVQVQVFAEGSQPHGNDNLRDDLEELCSCHPRKLASVAS